MGSLFNWKLLNAARYLQPTNFFTVYSKLSMNSISDRGKAKENVHFLKIQLQQLERLMKNKLKEEKKNIKSMKELLKDMENLREKISDSERRARGQDD